jgi:hypothetical protein
MWRSAQAYHKKLIEGISGVDLQTWEAEISRAEDMRKQDKSVMDIIGAKQPQCHDADGPEDAAGAKNADPPEQWLRLAIQIEQKQ